MKKASILIAVIVCIKLLLETIAGFYEIHSNDDESMFVEYVYYPFPYDSVVCAFFALFLLFYSTNSNGRSKSQVQLRYFMAITCVLLSAKLFLDASAGLYEEIFEAYDSIISTVAFYLFPYDSAFGSVLCTILVASLFYFDPKPTQNSTMANKDTQPKTNTTSSNFESPEIDFSYAKHPNETPRFILALIICTPIAILALLLTVFSYGLVILYVLLIAFFVWISLSILEASLIGNSARVTEKNFPDVYRNYLNVKSSLKYDKEVPIYIIEEGSFNAMLAKFFGSSGFSV